MNTNENWILLSPKKDNSLYKMYSINGLVYEKQSVFVKLDWNKIKEDKKGVITIKSGDNIITINVEAKKYDLSEIESNTYIMTHDYATLDVSKYDKLVDGKGINIQGNEVDNKFFIIPDNGKYRTALRTTSSTITYEDVDDLNDAPYAQYKVFVPEDGMYNLQCQFNPTSNLVYGKVRLRYGVKIDEEDIDIINTISEDYLAGSWARGKWTIDIENNSRNGVKQNITLTKGVHTIKYYQCDPNVALIRMVLFKGKLANVYGTPEESPFIK